jgi:TRAP-type C4-dicarboxylate transport system substrate-binding protein
VVPELDRRLAAQGVPVEIRWTEAYAGSLFKWQDTLEAVEIGLTDLGWVGMLWEGSKLPLQNATYALPFVTDDLPALLNLWNDLHEQIPELNQAWDARNQVFLGSTGVETYHLLTDFPVRTLDDLKGRKILAPGSAALWLQGTGAVAVDGALTTFYTQMQTGVADGVLSIVTAAYPYRLYEVAPHITLVGLGAQVNGALAINKKTFNRLPVEVQGILRRLGRDYSDYVAKDMLERYENAVEVMTQEGAHISELPPGEKQRWIDGLPEMGQQWVERNERKGLPARRVLDAFMDGVRAYGDTPLRAWDEFPEDGGS